MENLYEIKSITTEEQNILLEKHLNERTALNMLLVDTESPDYKRNVILINQQCSDSFQFFCNNFLWLQDPEAEDYIDKELPYLLWDFQEQAATFIIEAIINGEDLPIEKCRKLGLTWLVLAILLWGWHYHKWEVLVGSRKAEEVDKRGDPGTLFEKFRFMIKKLPEEILHQQLDKDHDKTMLIRHPDHDATLAGEGNNMDFGRSDRRKVVFLDELTSWLQTDRAAYQGLSATTKCRLSVSTPNVRGVNCWFYKVVQDHKAKGKPVLVLPYDLHPEFSKGKRIATENDKAFSMYSQKYTTPWLENEIERASDKQSVAQEILIDYEASMAGKVFGEFDLKVNKDEDIEYNPDLPLYVAWDFGLDQTAMLWIQFDRKNQLYYIIDEYTNNGDAEGDNIYHYLEILDSKPYKKAIHFGDPHSGNNRSLTSGQSPASILRRQGIIFRSKRTPINTRVSAGRNIITQVRVSPDCILAIEMFTSWQMRAPKSGNTTTSIPDHSEHSHIGEAYTYFAYNFKNRFKQKNHQKKKFGSSISGVV